MPTINQLVKGLRGLKRKIKEDWILNNCPQKKATILKLRTAKPRKPNSAIWKIAKVRVLSSGLPVVVYIPGQGHSLQEHSQILIKGGRIPDLPGVWYKAVKGKLDFTALEWFQRMKRWSKFGVPLPKKNN